MLTNHFALIKYLNHFLLLEYDSGISQLNTKRILVYRFKKARTERLVNCDGRFYYPATQFSLTQFIHFPFFLIFTLISIPSTFPHSTLRASRPKEPFKRSSTPLMKRLESALENSLDKSIASLIETIGGMSLR